MIGIGDLGSSFCPQSQSSNRNSRDEVRRPGHWRRSCRHRGGSRGRAHGPEDGSSDRRTVGDRPDVVQPGHRRARQGAARARNRRARGTHGRPRRPRGHSVQGLEPLPRPRGLGAARAVRQGALFAPGAAGPGRDAESHARRRHGRGLPRRAGTRGRRRDGGGPVDRGGGGRRDDGDIPARPDAHGGEEDGGRPRRRGRGQGALGGPRPAGPETRPFQDRHAAARPPRQRGLRGLRAAAGRRSPGPLLLPHRKARRRAGPLLADRDQRERPPVDPREPPQEPHVLRADPGHRPALLPLDRRQGRAVRGEAAPHDLPRARRLDGAGDLHQRALDVAPGGGPARDPGRDPRLDGRADAAPRLRCRVRLLLPRPAPRHARNAGGARSLLGGPDQRDLRLRGGRGAGALWRGSTRRSRSREKSPSCSSARRPTRRS